MNVNISRLMRGALLLAVVLSLFARWWWWRFRHHPPTTTALTAVPGTDGTSATLSVTINEDGIGYYLVQPSADAAPTVAAMQTGTAFAMTANVTVTQTISGLTPGTAYTIYFVAKDMANNLQATVQRVVLPTVI